MKPQGLRMAVIGCGYWGPNLIRNVIANEKVDHVVCCDRDLSRLELMKRRFPSVHLETDADVVFADETIDAVLIATPLTHHFPLAKAALEAGKHVFVEKPFTGSTDEANQLIDLARAGGRIAMVGHTFLYSPPVRKIKSLIEDGTLGDIRYITSSRVNLGLHQTDISVIWDLAPHDFSMLLYWLGETPTEISAMGQDFVQAGIPDVAFVNMRFPSGTVANVNVSWLSPSKIRQTTIVGSRKMLIYDDTAPSERVKIFDKGVDLREPSSFGEFHLSYRTGDIVSPKLDTDEPLGAEMAAFVRAIETGDPPPTSGENGRDVVRMLEAAEASLTSTPVRLPAAAVAGAEPSLRR